MNCSAYISHVNSLLPTLLSGAQEGSDGYAIVRLLCQDQVLIPSLIAGSIVVIVIVRTAGAVLKSAARERTRREIAAFIAEGSMTPEQGERLMKAGDKRDQA